MNDHFKTTNPDDETLPSAHTDDGAEEDAMLRLNDDLMRSALKQTNAETGDLDKLFKCFQAWAEARDSLKRRPR